jgi:hypothetical protein
MPAVVSFLGVLRLVFVFFHSSCFPGFCVSTVCRLAPPPFDKLRAVSEVELPLAASQADPEIDRWG